MKSLLTVSFVSLIGLVCLTQLTLSQECLEYLKPIHRYETKVVNCPMVSTNDKRQLIPTPAASDDSMFIVNFNCSVNDKVICDKVHDVLITAGKFITATLNLKSAVSLDAQFVNFCTTYGDCGLDKVILGATRPGRMIPQQDTDGKVRLYPQALLKQMSLPEHPQFGSSDIITAFNSNTDYWFEGDPLPILENSPDMLYVVIHELIHGLGFTTAWRDYYKIQALTPIPIPSTTAKGQFFEFVFDKNLVLLPSGKSLTSVIDELNEFSIDSVMTDNEVANSFMKSPQFPIAQDMYKSASIHGTIGFLTTPNLPPNTQLTQDDVILLETSLVPFQRGSSVAHVDLRTYLDTSDFLMMYSYPKITLGQMMFKAGSANITGPIGPKLRLLLGILGYDVKKDYVPPVTLSNLQSDDFNPFGTSHIPKPSNKSSNKPNNVKTNNSSLVTFNLVLSLICILLTLHSIYSKY